ncbi:hypothetical protein HMI54_013532 [Coelomomyces lativittatus]|nr:hypothetical protein HMI54_013532 [Coelomomyces lativittatus]
MREFTNAYYGTGTGFEEGCKILQDPKLPLYLFKYMMETHLVQEHEIKLFKSKFMGQFEQQSATNILEDLLKLTAHEVTAEEIFELYSSPTLAVDGICQLLNDLADHKYTPLDMLREMYHKYPPFRYSIENKVKH